jgi:hypothetical protein
MRKVCTKCGRLFTPFTAAGRPSSRCPLHAAYTTAQRGYGTDHTRLRKQTQILINKGGINCARCGQPIKNNEPWHLDHTDDRTGYLGASHTVCNCGNRQGGGYKAAPPPNDPANQPGGKVIRPW